MAHQLDRSDIIDLLEEAITLKHPVAIKLRGGRHFVDRVRDVVTTAGQDQAVFKEHGTLPLDDIAECARAQPVEPTYAGKR